MRACARWKLILARVASHLSRGQAELRHARDFSIRVLLNSLVRILFAVALSGASVDAGTNRKGS